MKVMNSSVCYDVGDRVADGEKYRTYVCTKQDTAQQCLLQIATEIAHNGLLDRWAYVLGELKRRSDEIEAEYAKVKNDPDKWLNYDLQFPGLVDSFLSEEQGGRRINVLSFRNVSDVRKLVPLDNLTSKDRLRVDLRTSAWIMGKTLKLQSFAHIEGVSVGLFTGRNILIEPDEHYVVVYDWSLARMVTSGDLPEADQRKDIMEAAQSVITVLGGDLATGMIPDVDDTTRPYADYLLLLAKGGVSSSEKAHSSFYELVDSIWTGFYPFTTKPLPAQG